jgi:hypothetical protein
MLRKSLKQKEFDRLKKLMAKDPALQKAVDSLQEQIGPQKTARRELLVPYVNAPPITGCAWK